MKKALIYPFGVVFLASILFIAVPLSAQERAAQLSTVSGSVTIRRAADGSVVEARQIGPRVQNGSVFPGDAVQTGAGASAALLFSDGTRINLKAQTTLVIEEKDLSALLEAGKQKQRFGRKIKVLAGDIWANVVPNAEVATEFETPNGVAAVKGTQPHIIVQIPEGVTGTSIEELSGIQTGWLVLLEVLEGEIAFSNDSMTFDLRDGYAITLMLLDTGVFRLLTPSTNPGPLKIKLPDGSTMSMAPGSEVTVTHTAAGAFNLTGAKGVVAVTSKLGTVTVLTAAGATFGIPLSVLGIEKYRERVSP